VLAKTVDALRHQCFCEVLQIQILRAHFDIKMRTRKMHATSKSKSFYPFATRPCSHKFQTKRESKKFLPDSCRYKQPDGSTTAVGCPAVKPREFQEGTSWRVSWLLLAARQEVTSKTGTARREAVRASGYEVVKILAKTPKSPSEGACPMDISLLSQQMNLILSIMGSEYARALHDTDLRGSQLPYLLTVCRSPGASQETLAGLLGVDKSEVMAFGDNGNDMEMIRESGFGVAVANARAEVKAVADYVCESNDEDGVAKTIRKFCFGE
jgi:hypothetical protein